MEYETYRIPANFTDAGRILGQFPIRNAVEAVILAAPPALLCFFYLPFSLTANLICALVAAVPLMGFALSGVNDDPLTIHVYHLFAWLLRRKILHYRGSPEQPNKLRRNRT